MSKFKFLSVIVLSVALAGAAYAGPGGRGGGGGGRGGGGGHMGGGGGHIGGGGHFGGAHFSGGRGGGAHFSGIRSGGARFTGGARHVSGGAAIRSAGGSGLSGNRALAVRNSATGLSGRNAAIGSSAVHHALNSRAVSRALHNQTALHNPVVRAQIAAVAATAGWHTFDRNGGWWRHGNGGYGWVGPLFWPFAYFDIYDYTLWGYDPSFWYYGYGDIYAGIFAPYYYDDLIGYLPPGGYAGAAPASRGSANANRANDLSQMCGEDSQEVAGLPIDRIQQAVQPNEAQRAALDDLANASVKAAQSIKAACPTQVASTAPGRLAAMQSRLEAMIAAVNMVEPPLDHFYGLLSDEQKSRLNAQGQDQRDRRRDEGALAQGCGSGQPGVTNWPAAEIDSRLHPSQAQRASLDNLKNASARAAELLKATCEPNEALTPPARLAAVGKRLDTMLQAVETVKAALDDLYADLSDEQKAQFEAIGPGRAALSATASDESAPASRRHSRHHHASIGGIVRRLISFGW